MLSRESLIIYKSIFFIKKACQNGHYDVSKFLIRSGADVTKVDRYGQNALHYAVASKNEKLVK